MAGIGFELRRVLTRGSLSDSVGATLSGVMIVAGPWLLTVVTLGVLGEAFRLQSLPLGDLFQASVIYSYALSLATFSAVHFLFIRLAADLIWWKREAQAVWWLVRFSALIALVSALLGFVAMAWMPLPKMDHPWVYRGATVLLFSAVNVLWVVMALISILRRYSRILLVYSTGMAVALALVLWWGAIGGVGGAVLGFAIGHVVIVVWFLVLCVVEYRPEAVPHAWREIRSALFKFRWLILAGGGIYLGQWLDKMVFWATRGTSVEGTWFQLYPAYDQAVYWAGLTAIPGLVYFVVVLETSFASALQKFGNRLLLGTYASIVRARQTLVIVTREEFGGLLLFQAAFTTLGVALAFGFSSPSLWLTLILAFAGVFFQTLLMVLVNLLFYGELHFEAALSVLVFLAFETVGSVVGGWWSWEPGLSFLVATACGCFTAWTLLSRGLATLDRTIYTRTWS